MLVYLAKLLLFRIYMFFVHWYRDGALFAYGTLLGALRRIDRAFGLRVNARFLFQPLYQERNITGYVLGFFFRLFRIGVGSIAAVFSTGVIIGLLIVWVALPVVLFVKAIQA